MKRKVVAIVQARMGSQRLPGKSLMELGGKPLVDHILHRVKQARTLDEVVLAIPDTEKDGPLEGRAMALGVACFKGSEDDLVGRYFEAATTYKADVVVRICADNPLIHPSEIDRIVQYFLSADVDFASNVNDVLGNGYPDGLGAEVMSFKALEWVHQNIKDPYSREHPHVTFYKEEGRFKLGTVRCPAEFSHATDVVLDINTREEYLFIKKLMEELQRNGELLHISQIIPWYRANYHLAPATYKK